MIKLKTVKEKILSLFNDIKERIPSHSHSKRNLSEEELSGATINESETEKTEEKKATLTYQWSKGHHEKVKKSPAWVQKISHFMSFTKSPIRRFWHRYRIGKVLLILTGIGVLTTGSYLYFAAKSTDVSDLQDALKATTVIYDQDGGQVGSLSGQKGTYVELDIINDSMKNAVTATENRTFYENGGTSYSHFFLALFTFGHSGDGSTTAQQLAKNTYLSQEQTITREAKEFFPALELTEKYTKDEILTIYLSNAYFGNSVRRVEDVSQKYFSTSAANLTIEQSAILTGMLKSSEIYNPYYSIENATNHRNTVLSVMVDAGKITQEEADGAEQVDVSSELNDTYTRTSDDYQYASYFDAVIQETEEIYGLSEGDIVNNGCKIYTELDQDYQINMQAVFDNTSYFPTSDYDGEGAQGASAVMEPSTGAVRGLVGRVNSTSATFRGFNYTAQTSCSPGSTIKPLVVYLPTVASGYSITTELLDIVRDYDGYAPTNYGGIETDDLPMYRALTNSYNILTVYLLNGIGINRGISYDKKLGLNMDNVGEELDIALGDGVTANPLEVAQTYSTFVSGGVMPRAHLITKIENASGDVIAEFKQSNKRVVNRSTADRMTSMMPGAFSNSSTINTNAYGYTITDKTGTMEASFNEDLIGDQWVVSYTPDVVIAQWTDYDSTDENCYLADASSGTASTIFSAVAGSILPHTAGTEFTAESTYSQNGYDLAYSTDDSADISSNSSSSNSDNILDKVRESTRDAGDTTGWAVKDVWDSFSSWFNNQTN